MKLIFSIKIHILVNTCTFQLHTLEYKKKTVWIKALYKRATKIWKNQKLLDDQMKKILSFMSWIPKLC